MPLHLVRHGNSSVTKLHQFFKSDRSNRNTRTQGLTVESLESRHLLSAESLVMSVAGGGPEVPESTSSLNRVDDGVEVHIEAGELPVGHAVTLWWVFFNNPELCEGPCNGPDLRNPDVEAGLFYGGGDVVGEDGTLTIVSMREEGDIAGVDDVHADFAGAKTGLIDSQTAEIHVALRSHGVAHDDPNLLAEQLGTFNEACNPDCGNLQAAAHLPPGVTFENQTMHVAGGGPEVEASTSRLTRSEDGVTVRIDAGELPAGDAVTLWWVFFNNPELCEGPCNGPDLRNPDVEAGLFYGGGDVVGEDGTLTIVSMREEGDIAGVDDVHADFAGAKTGLIDSQTAEIHVALRSHGVAHDDPNLLAEQLGTFNEACNPDCGNLQAAAHLPPGVTFDNQTMHVAGGGPEVEASTSRLTRSEDGVTVRIDAGELPAGDAVTLWWVFFNNPELCEGPCNGPDLRNPEVEAGLFYGGGDVVGEDGTLTIVSMREEGDIAGVDDVHADFAGAKTGLIDSQTAEIHVALRSHGVAHDDPDLLAEQLGTFNEACNPECGNLQAAAHLPPGDTITIGAVHEFNGPPAGPDIEGAESRLTREEDGMTLTVSTHSLDPGAYTVWWVVFNNPEFCSGNCNGNDFGNSNVDALVTYATGEVVGEDGIGKFRAYLAEGDTSGIDPVHAGFSGAGDGLIDSQKAEIHYVIRNHGPASDDPDMLAEQLGTFNGGCMTDGLEGFECHDPQAGFHMPPERIVLGDSNGDGQFDELDIVEVLQTAKYRTGQPATFAEGDWNNDGFFDQLDVIVALQTGNYRAAQGMASRLTPNAVDRLLEDYELQYESYLFERV